MKHTKRASELTKRGLVNINYNIIIIDYQSIVTIAGEKGTS